MKFKLIIILFFIASCAQNYSTFENKKNYSSKGFAYIYKDIDYENKILKK